MAEAVELAVVGHTNAGKTSLLRTLTRRKDFGDVSDRPGTTRHVEAIALRIDGVEALRYLDTPGLEDSTGLLVLLQTLDRQLPPPERIRAFLRLPEAAARFEQEAKVLRVMLDTGAAFYVVDTREPVLPKHRSELEILSWCARPVMPVLNFVRDPASREAAWMQAMADHGLHVITRFDAVAPFVGSEQRLYRNLATLLPAQEALLAEVCEHLEFERLNRRSAAHQVVAGLLVAVASARLTLGAQDLQDPGRRDPAVAAFRSGVLDRARSAIAAVLEIQAFDRDEAQLDLLPWLDGRWADDLFNPEMLKGAGKALGTGALIGASVGLAADVALAGLSLGTAAVIGAAIGGAASQGLGAVGRVLMNKLRGRVDLTVEDEVIALLAEQMLQLVLTLEQRGHAAVSAVVLRGVLDASTLPQCQELLAVLGKARAHPEWSAEGAAGPSGHARRAAVVDAVVAVLRRMAAAADAGRRSPPPLEP